MEQAQLVGTIHRVVWIALIAALIAVSSWFPIPIGPVPISLQTMFVLLSGLLLGPRNGAIAILLYIGAGCIGLPVFSGGKAGFGIFAWGPTSGYLWGWIPAAIVTGLSVRGRSPSLFTALAGCIVASCLYMTIGWLRLASVLNVSLLQAFTVGVAPFLIGDAIKCVAAAGIYRYLRTHRLLPR